MLRALTVMLVLGSASAYSGTICSSPSYGGSDNCENNECRITGSSRRRLSRVGAKFCVGGAYKHIWYSTSTTEAQCNASLLTFASSLDAPFEVTSSMPLDQQAKGQKGECYVEEVKTDAQQQESYKYTCQGIPDGKPPTKMVYTGSICDTHKYNSSSGVHEHDGKKYPCFCNSDDGKYEPASSCVTCDETDNKCSTSNSCTKAQRGICSWASNKCSCKSGIFMKSGSPVCVGGALHDVYFEASSNTGCKAMTAGSYIKFATNTRRREAANCKGKDGTQWKDGTQYTYKSTKDADCTGVADGQPPKQLFYTDTACATAIPNATKTGDFHECTCQPEGYRIRSECRSCSGSSCTTQDSCLMSQEGTCAWNPAASSNQCSCASKVFKSEKMCWGGVPSEITYENADYTQCMSGDKTKVVFHRSHDLNDDGDFRCEHNGDQSKWGQGDTTGYKQRAQCSGVADGQPAKTGYFSDDKCTTLVSSEAMDDTSNQCRCELYNGCKKDTKFEKFYCDGANVIAQEFNDDQCKTPSGAANRTVSSPTDALSLGVCGAWPPIALKPNFDMSVKLSCAAIANGISVRPVSYSTWSRIDFESMAPACPGTAQNTGTLTDCFCKDQLNFNEIAKEANVQVEGDLTLAVSDVTAAIADTQFKKVMKSTIAETAGVNPANIVNLELAAARRLSEAKPRKLAAGSIKASYIIVVPKAQEATVTKSVGDATPATITAKVQTKVASAGVSFTATVSAKAAPTSAPAVVAVTTSGTVSKSGVSADGTANPPEGSASGALGALPSVMYLMAVLAAASKSSE